MALNQSQSIMQMIRAGLDLAFEEIFYRILTDLTFSHGRLLYFCLPFTFNNKEVNKSTQVEQQVVQQTRTILRDLIS